MTTATFSGLNTGFGCDELLHVEVWRGRRECPYNRLTARFPKHTKFPSERRVILTSEHTTIDSITCPVSNQVLSEVLLGAAVTGSHTGSCVSPLARCSYCPFTEVWESRSQTQTQLSGKVTRSTEPFPS